MNLDPSKTAQIRALITDVDGVLNNGTVIMSEKWEGKSFSIRDGFAIKAGIQIGFDVAILSGRLSSVVQKRASELSISHVKTGRLDKQTAFRELLAEMDLQASEVAYVGDDIPDLPPLSLAGLSFCPQDAVPEVIARASVTVPVKGGEGVVRWIIESILRQQNRWQNIVDHFEVKP